MLVELFRVYERSMKGLILALLFCAVVFAPSFFSSHTVVAFDETVVTAAQVNGTWVSGSNTFKVFALGKQKLKVEFYGTYEYESKWGPTANTGEASGIAHIKGDTAIFKPDKNYKDCIITMKFTEGKLIVEQEGICPFGFNVSAGDTYRRVSKQKPKFNE